MKLLLLDRPKDKEIISKREVEFFGPWAQPATSPDELLPPVFEPYPDADAVYKASFRAMDTADRIIGSLTKIMPGLTGVRKGERFWRLLLGHHVILLVNLIEDIKLRYLSLPDKDYVLGLPSRDYSQNYIPNSWSEAIHLLVYDDYFKWHAMALCLKDRYRDYELIEYSNIPRSRIVNGYDDFFTKIFQGYPRLMKKLELMLFERAGILHKDGKLCDGVSSLVWDQYQMEGFDFHKLKACIIPEKYLYDRRLLSLLEADKEKRKEIAGAFSFPYGEFLSITMPLITLEGLPSLISLIDYDKYNTFKKIRRVYTHGQAFAAEEPKRVLCALLAEDGKEIISIQHGCAHTYFANSGMYPERVIADKNIHWGSGFSHYPELPSANKTKAMSSIYLFNVKKKSLCHKRNKWDMLFVVLEENRYIKWLYSPLFPDLAFDYFRRQKILFDYFCTDRKIKTAIKIYPETYGWGQADWIQSKYPAATIIKAGKFVNYFFKSKLAIIDYNGTAFLEMLAIGKPFLATWNRRWFKGMDRFEEFIDKLIEINVFYESPGTLIKSYQEIASLGIASWWNEKKRQDILTEMANNFAMSSDTVYEEWAREFSEA